MLEDVNNILNSGDVPNLYGPEEMEQIMAACRPICAKKRIPATKLNVFAQVIPKMVFATFTPNGEHGCCRHWMNYVVYFNIYFRVPRLQ